MSTCVEIPMVPATASPPAEPNVAREAAPPLRVLSAPALLLLGFLLMSYANTLSPFLEGIGFLTDRVGMYTLLWYPLLLGGAVAAFELTRKTDIPLWKGYIVVYLLLLATFGVLGLATGGQFRIIAFDIITYCTVLAGFVLGRRDEVWRLLRWPVAVLSAVGILIAFRFTDALVLTDRSILNTQLGSFGENVLVLATLFLITANAHRSRYHYLLMAAVACGVLLIYLYFGRRSTSVRTMAEIVTGLVLLPALFFGRRGQGVAASAGLAVMLVGILMYFPLDTLKARFSRTYGVVDTMTTGNERWEEVELLLNEFSFVEILSGRGLGGTFMHSSFATEFEGDERADSTGRTTLHVGFGAPLLKGGLIWWAAYFFPLFYVVSNLRRIRRFDPLTICVSAAALIWLATQAIEGTPTYSVAWVGFGTGLIGGRAQNISWLRKTNAA